MGRSPTPMQSRYTDANGLRIHSRTPSMPVPEDAPRVVLVHGLGVSSRYLVPLARQLAGRCEVHCVDLPGFGKSDKPEQVLNVPQLADSLAAWMRVVGLTPATLLANSFGCQVVIDLAQRYPELAAQLVLQGPSMDAHARNPWVQLGRWLRNGLVEPLSLYPILALDFLSCGLIRMLKTFRYALDDPLIDKLPHVQAPTLVIRGTRDGIAPQPWVEEMVHLLPRGRLVVWPKGPHTICFWAPAALAELIRPFLAEYWGQPHSGDAPPGLPLGCNPADARRRTLFPSRDH